MAARGQMTVCRVGFVFVVPDMWEVGGLNRERVQRLRCQLIIYLPHSPSLNTNHLTSHLKHMPRAHTETHRCMFHEVGPTCHCGLSPPCFTSGKRDRQSTSWGRLALDHSSRQRCCHVTPPGLKKREAQPLRCVSFQISG